jgi:hypothetical protein
MDYSKAINRVRNAQALIYIDRDALAGVYVLAVIIFSFVFC